LQVKFDIDQVDKGKRIQSWNGHLPIVVGGEKKRGFFIPHASSMVLPLPSPVVHHGETVGA
jgi:hypothetical protein